MTGAGASSPKSGSERPRPDSIETPAPDARPSVATGRARRPSRGVVWATGLAVVALQLVLMWGAFTPAPHTGGDNAGYIALAWSLLERGQYLDLHDPAEPPHTKYPPGFPLVLAAAISSGATTWVELKMIPALFTTLSVILAFAWVNRRRGPIFATGIAFLLAISDAYLWSSHWVLSDPMFVALTLMALYALDRAGTGGAAPPASRLSGRAAPETATTASPETTSLPREEDAEPEVHRALVSPAPALWLALGATMAICAYFTRSAGLPLIVAAAAWLALGRRWRSLAAFGVAFLVPAFLWWSRSRHVGGSEYLSEFWMVDPYRPGLGRAGPLDLATRAWENLWGYVGTHVPIGLTGLEGVPMTLLGAGVVGLAVLGWLRHVRRRVTATELFVPLYLGLILLWPQVWSGDRFALPLFPFILFYAGDVLTDLTSRVHRRGPAVAATLAVVLVAAPAAWVWLQRTAAATNCWALVEQLGPFGCYGPRVQEFTVGAYWAGLHLPQDAVVLTRKPRIFFLESGVKSRTYPLSGSSEVFLEAAADAGARYLLVDYLDALGSAYLAPVIQGRMGDFCTLTGWGGDEDGVRTELMGIVAGLPDTEWEPEPEEGGVVTVTLRPCPTWFWTEEPKPVEGYFSMEIPLLSSPSAPAVEP